MKKVSLALSEINVRSRHMDERVGDFALREAMIVDVDKRNDQVDDE